MRAQNVIEYTHTDTQEVSCSTGLNGANREAKLACSNRLLKNTRYSDSDGDFMWLRTRKYSQ